jgi:signal transduction histidine kinase/CheY-like chemotaxis protein
VSDGTARRTGWRGRVFAAGGGLRLRQPWATRLPRALAIGFGLAAADADVASRLRAAQINGIVRLTPLTMGASCLNAAILMATLANMGSIGWPMWVWAATLFAVVLRYTGKWWDARKRDPHRRVTPKAIRRSVLHGALFGTLWGVVPVLTFAGAPALTQLLVGCLVAGMMCAGGFALATVPPAGVAYVLTIAAGAFFALLQGAAPVYLGLTALMVVYTGVVIVNLNWNAYLFIEHFLAETRIEKEVAARERAQAQAAHAERMTTLGALASGIAHDFNNTLQAVAGNAELIARRANDTREVQRLANMLLDAAERGGAISRRLLVFARRDSPMAEPVDPAGLLADLQELLRRTLGGSIDVRARIAPVLPSLLADRRQLETVLLNLATNARDALPNGGEVVLAADCETVAGNMGQPNLAPGRYIRLSVSDTGVGMDAATLDRAAEPFFTTKPRGKGTGLGLSMAKGFAEQSGGGLTIESEPGRGAIVTLWLPQTEQAAVRLPEVAVKTRIGERRHVLLVDDDAAVRDVLRITLAEAGFMVAGAENGAMALAHMQSGAPVDAVVTDFAMPGMNGLDLLRIVQAANPDLPGFMLTGHAGDLEAALNDSGLTGRFTLLRKPIRPAQLAHALAATLC